ncbi:hypothetical protein Tco_0111011, partial [Tanacetum coccineum]
RTQSQPSSSTVPPPPTSQPAPTESTTTPPIPITEPTSEPSSPSTTPEHESMEHNLDQPSPEHQPSSPRQESDIPQTQAPTHTHEAEIGYMLVDDLFQLVPQLMTRIESLEKDLKQAKQTLGNAIVKLVKKVKKMEKVVKSRRVVLTDSEDEAAENSSKQGRNLQKNESEVFETPKQGKSSREIDISPQGLEAAETLAEALSQIKTKRRKKCSKTKVRRRLGCKDVSTGFEKCLVKEKETVSRALEETPQTERTKETNQRREARWMEIGSDKEAYDEELKEKFEYLMRSMERFVPMDTKKESRKRTGVELQTESSKKLKRSLNLPSWTEVDVEVLMEERGLKKNLKGFYGVLKDYGFDPQSEEDYIGSCTSITDTHLEILS